MTDFNLSVSDLIYVDGFKEAFAEADQEKIRQHLFRNGMDVDKEYELVVVAHRNLRNQVVNGQRFEGQERTDEAWLKSGYASIEARIEATKDASLRHTLRTMHASRTQETIFD